ncbi:MAG: acetate--CoA ligase family protein, partial [Nitrososphaerales archaeon]
PRFAADAAEFAAKAGKPLVVSTPQLPVAAAFAGAGCAVFEEEFAAVAALSQHVIHSERRRAARRRQGRLVRRRPAARRETLDESASLDLLSEMGLPVVAHRRCTDAPSAVAAFEELGGPVVVKGCSSRVAHKSELGLVHLGLDDPGAVAAAAACCLDRMAAAGIESAALLVAPMVGGVREVLLGAHLDPVFGPVVAVGAGGTYVEVLADVALLLPPFTKDDALGAIARLAMAPLLEGVRGEAAATVDAWASAAVLLGRSIADLERSLESVDANPYFLAPRGGGGGVIVDAVVQVGHPG